jgi:3-oxoacyl-[acyl-carrier-protein] synthase II
MPDDVVITGMGLASPIGCDEPTFWESLTTGRSGAAPVAGFDTSDLPRRIACQIHQPIDGRDGDGRASRLAARAARQAVNDAVLGDAPDALSRTCIVIGTTMGETEFIEERLDANPEDWLSGPHLRRILAGRPGCISQAVNRELGMSASTIDLYGACAAGNMALAQARRRLLDGRYDIALAGGADGFSRLAFIGFMRLRVMAAERCRPFDEQRDGLFVGEGAAVFVLERESDARARGARVRARIVGTGVSCEDHHPTRPHPEGDGLARATRAALAEADLSPAHVDYVCAHGTGTPQNDAIEIAMMNRIFPEATPFSSIKALTGHTMGAAAALEAAACVLSLEHQTLIPTWNLENVLRPCRMHALQGSSRPARVRCVVNNSAGFGGYNSSLVLAVA